MPRSTINPRAATFTPLSTPTAPYATPFSEDPPSTYSSPNPEQFNNSIMYQYGAIEDGWFGNDLTSSSGYCYEQCSCQAATPASWVPMGERPLFNFEPHLVQYDPLYYGMPFAIPFTVPTAHYELPILPWTHVDYHHKVWSKRPPTQWGSSRLEELRDQYKLGLRKPLETQSHESTDASFSSSEVTTPLSTYASVVSRDTASTLEKTNQQYSKSKSNFERPENHTNKQSHTRSNSPPKDAPKAPLAMELAGWTQSKTWTSKEKADAIAFHKMRRNLRHIHAHNSPFVPQTPIQLALLKATMATRHLHQKLERSITTTNRLRNENLSSSKIEVTDFCNGRYPKEGSASLFPGQTYFSHGPALQQQVAHWPTVSEYIEHSCRINANYKHCFPFPNNGFLGNDANLGSDCLASNFALGHILPVDYGSTANSEEEETDIDWSSCILQELISSIEES